MGGFSSWRNSLLEIAVHCLTVVEPRAEKSRHKLFVRPYLAFGRGNLNCWTKQGIFHLERAVTYSANAVLNPALVHVGHPPSESASLYFDEASPTNMNQIEECP